MRRPTLVHMGDPAQHAFNQLRCMCMRVMYWLMTGVSEFNIGLSFLDSAEKKNKEMCMPLDVMRELVLIRKSLESTTMHDLAQGEIL